MLEMTVLVYSGVTSSKLQRENIFKRDENYNPRITFTISIEVGHRKSTHSNYLLTKTGEGFHEQKLTTH